MARCQYCNKEMNDPKTESCIKMMVEFPDGTPQMEPDTSYYDINERCHDCGIVNKPGNYHHPGCDIERCPRCEGQLISCGCLDDSEYIKKLENMSFDELRKLARGEG